MTAVKLVQEGIPEAGLEKNCLGDDVRRHMENYFRDLDGHDVSDLYELFISEVEKPMFEIVMQMARGNITRAASMLGLNRGTLRNRLKKYNLA